MANTINPLDYILPTVKRGVGGIDLENTDFDDELIMHINTVLRGLNQMGIGNEGFAIEGNDELWTDFLPVGQRKLQDVKTYVSMAVKKIFDPPVSSIKLQAMDEVIKEARDRIFMEENWSSSDYPSYEPSYKSKKKMEEFLYEMEYDELDYDYAKEYFDTHSFVMVSGCTAVKQGNFIGRNLDWTYGNAVEFLVRTPKTDKYFKTIGVSGQISELTNEFMESGEDSEMFKLVPFYLTDGINEAGLFCEINVVPNQKGNTTGTIPDVQKLDSVCSLMLVRYVLDRFSEAQFAAEYIRDYVSVFVPGQLRAMGYEVHFMIADATNTYCLEFVNNKTIIKDINQLPFITNFFIDGVIFNPDHTVCTPIEAASGHKATIENLITSYGSGLERHNLIVNYLENNTINSVQDMRKLMNKLMYTNAYKEIDPLWYTEFVGGELTVDSIPDDFAEALAKVREDFENRKRDGGPKTWQTNHSSVYDLENLTLQLVVQEHLDSKYELSLN